MRTVALLTTTLLILTALSGCFGPEEVAADLPEEEVWPEGVFVTGPDGNSTEGVPLDLNFTFSDVGVDGPEPSIGITSSGCMFFVAMAKVMRSCDAGQSWEDVANYASAPTTSDPYLWVDPVTDRIFNVQMVGLATTWIGWSDDDGDNWLGNPHDSGPIPLNDHIKLASGPWTDEGYGVIGQGNPTYSEAVYFCYNKLAGIFCYTSFDGGQTFEVGGQIYGLATTNGGLHGAITTSPDGTVYLPPRVSTPTVLVSKDNGITWDTKTMGIDAGTPDPRKNTEVGTDSESNAYHIWTGADFGVYLSRSTDSGETWEQESIRLSPNEIISTTFPQIDAGDPGRIAVTYLGSENSSVLGQTDLDGNPWNGNGHYAPADVSYYLYVTFSLNALDDEPVFHTKRISADPVQIGAICLNSGDCRDIGGSNRNLLDFNDLTIDLEGRVYIAFADGCTGECATKENPQPEDSRSRRGAVYYLSSGPSLFVEIETLESLISEQPTPPTTPSRDNSHRSARVSEKANELTYVQATDESDQ